MTNFTLYATPKPNVIYFEHNHLGEDCAGSMWFDDKVLVDYDGVFDLPQDVINMMLKKGYNMDYVTDVLFENEYPHSTGVKDV